MEQQHRNYLETLYDPAMYPCASNAQERATRRPTASELQKLLGRATWVWDDEMGMHLPTCSRYKYDIKRGTYQCGNGPLSDPEIVGGTCTEGPHLERHERSY
jgi:hypothetical protein